MYEMIALEMLADALKKSPAYSPVDIRGKKNAAVDQVVYETVN